MDPVERETREENAPGETLVLFGNVWAVAFLAANVLIVSAVALGSGFRGGASWNLGTAAGAAVVPVILSVVLGPAMGAVYAALNWLMQRLGPAASPVQRSLGISMVLVGLLRLIAPVLPIVVPWEPVVIATLIAGWVTPWMEADPSGEHGGGR